MKASSAHLLVGQPLASVAGRLDRVGRPRHQPGRTLRRPLFRCRTQNLVLFSCHGCHRRLFFSFRVLMNLSIDAPFGGWVIFGPSSLCSLLGSDRGLIAHAVALRENSLSTQMHSCQGGGAIGVTRHAGTLQAQTLAPKSRLLGEAPWCFNKCFMDSPGSLRRT